MSAIARIQDKLANYPEARSIVEGSGETRTITVLPADAESFAVSLTQRPGHWTVGYDGWHEEFANEDAALNCFAFGLSAACRLRVEYRGRVPVKWTVEALEDGAWVEDSTTGILHPFFWRRATMRYLRNRLIPVEPNAARATSG